MKRFDRHRVKSAPRRDEAMDCVPLKSAAALEVQRDGQGVLLAFPAPAMPRMAGLLRSMGIAYQPAPRQRKLQLDTLGTAVWDLVDGRRSVAQVAQCFAERFRLHPREAEVSVALFLRDLGRRGLVGLR